MDNYHTIVGNLTRPPALSYTAAGKSVANFTVAINNPSGKTTFMPVAVFGQQAENCLSSLTKGTRVIVSGRTDANSWTTSDGRLIERTQLFAAHVGVSLQFTTATPHTRKAVSQADVETDRLAMSHGMEWDEGEMRWIQVRPDRNQEAS
jgi:single stranded DNA-binding protein